MSISPVGNSDAYDRYRQQQLSLLTSASQANSQTVLTPQTTTPAPSDSGSTAADPVSSGSYAAQFKADLSALSSPQEGASGPHGTHGGHHHHQGGSGILSVDSTDLVDPDSTTVATDDTANSSDPFTQALDAFAGVVKQTADTAA